jgi:hypothetical protein
MILQYLDSLNWGWCFFLVAIFLVFFTTLGILLVRKAVNLRRVKDCHDITGIIFSNLGALYAVLLGFTIVNAQERFDKIKETTQVEAACLIDLYRDSDFFSKQDREKIRAAITGYAESIIGYEWSQKKPHADTNEKFKDLLHCYYAIDIQTPKETIWYTASVEQLNKLSDLRLSRILGSQESLGSAMWTILILGGCAMVVFLCFLGPEKPAQHLLMASILVITIAFSLLLIHFLDTAFTGSVSVQSDALQSLLQVIRQDLLQT